MMTPKQKILHHVNPKGLGVEIGPSFNPSAPKRDGYRVHTIDHMSREELITKYRDHSVNLDFIEEVDFIWRGESYAQLTGKKKFYDWIIAAHLVEHTPDLIGFLNNCDTILKNDGIVSLVVPDKRYCFDHYRPITDISKIIDNHFQKQTIHSPGTVAGYFLNVVFKGGLLGWEYGHPGKYQLVHSLEEAAKRMNSVIQDKAYIDIHAWCFVPHSFRLIIHDLFCLGLIPFQEIDFFYTDNFEFYITLGRAGKGISKTRLEMLHIIESEIRERDAFFKVPIARSYRFTRRLARSCRRRLRNLF